MDPYRPPGYQTYSPYGPPPTSTVPPNMYHQMPPGMAPTGYPPNGIPNTLPPTQPMMRPMIRPMGYPGVGAPIAQAPPMGTMATPNSEKLTTLFVGKIPPGVPDDWLEKILQTCGTVVKWNRVKDPSGNPKGFGFCEYADAEGILRALRILGGEGQDPESVVNIPSIAEGGIPKKLLLRADDKTRKYLDQFEASRTSLDDLDADVETRQEIQKVIQSMLETLLGSEAIAEEGQDKNVSSHDQTTKSVNATRDRSYHHDDRSQSRDQRADRRERSPTFSEEEAEEQRRAEKRRREMEMAYREREKRWENHEMSRAKMYERNMMSDREREERRIRERDFMEKRLREWNDDEEEELGEEEYYRDRSRWWRYRQAERERELEQDERDRKLEQDEIKAAEAAAKKAEEIRQHEEQSKISNGSNQHENIDSSVAREHTKLKLNLSTKKTTVAPVANNDGNVSSDEDAEGKKRKRILVPLEYSDDEDAETKALRKKHKIKELVKEIPADKDGLWNWNMKWDYITDSVLKSKIEPFIAKKIVEYLGVEEKELVAFVTEHVRKHNPPQALVDELTMALDDEAPVFVMKLWRMVIFESEAHARKLA
ncbi:hypothetical protein K7432_005233 [Basidiobolus ranarum]|uniref:RNA-binding protein 25 n=1 Tax=Basidiobolus ranarum TaxID=34480 RepID=A0ABR2WWU3_9FUNG